MNIMFVVYQPGDEVLAFAGIIQKYVKQGHNVRVYFFTETKDESHFKNIDIVKEKLGYKKIILETIFKESHFDKNLKLITDIINIFEPDILYSISDTLEYNYISKIIKLATTTISPFFVKKIYFGEMNPIQFPTYYVPLSKEEMNIKTECLKIYQHKIMPWPHPYSEKAVINLSERRGIECKENFAESFITFRNVE